MCLAVVTRAVAEQMGVSPPELVLINGKILTMDLASTIAEALAIRDGKILAVGSNAAIKL